MDEVGLIVRRITEDGFLLVERLGGMHIRSLPGASLDLWTARGCVVAHAGVLPQHLDNTQFLGLEHIYLDIGASTRAEAESMGVRVGDGLTWSCFPRFKGVDRIVSKALDDRLGCLALLSLAQNLQPADINCDLFLAFVVQEETGLMGGVPLVNQLAPDIVIGVDGTLAFDTPDLQGQQSDIRLGGGPAVKLMDAIRGKTGSYLPDWGLSERLRSLAQQHDIPLQLEVTTGLSTAVTPLPFAAAGTRTAALSIPIRYHHSPVETAHPSDVTGLLELLSLFLGQVPS
jgi:putative aminopeptidase FrvX